MTHKCTRLNPIKAEPMLTITKKWRRSVSIEVQRFQKHLSEHTKITINGVDYQTSGKLEDGLIDSKQQSKCYTNTTCGKTRSQNAGT